MALTLPTTKRRLLWMPPGHSPFRFLIPLIDVLLVLFGLFMIVQVMQTPPKEGNAKDNSNRAKTLAPALDKDHQVEELRKKLTDLTQKFAWERESLRSTSAFELSGMLAVSVLQIHPGDGHLFLEDGQTIRTEAQARAYIETDRARQSAGVADTEKKLVYLLRFPRTESLFPTRKQVMEYQRWFKGTVLSSDPAPISTQKTGEKNP
ncbi:MAG: hypothetical protein WCO91_03850 [Gemmataceae bacterium]|nr:hypothetical protein [Planctomycetota bacterium]